MPWRLMKGMRNRIAHNACDIDMSVVWETVDVHVSNVLEKLPALRSAIFSKG